MEAFGTYHLVRTCRLWCSPASSGGSSSAIIINIAATLSWMTNHYVVIISRKTEYSQLKRLCAYHIEVGLYSNRDFSLQKLKCVFDTKYVCKWSHNIAASFSSHGRIDVLKTVYAPMLIFTIASCSCCDKGDDCPEEAGKLRVIWT